MSDHDSCSNPPSVPSAPTPFEEIGEVVPQYPDRGRMKSVKSGFAVQKGNGVLQGIHLIDQSGLDLLRRDCRRGIPPCFDLEGASVELFGDQVDLADLPMPSAPGGCLDGVDEPIVGDDRVGREGDPGIPDLNRWCSRQNAIATS